MRYTYKKTAKGTDFEFENGTILESHAADSRGFVTYPARNGIGEMSFPVRHSGDVFHAFRMGEASASNVPSHCRAW